MNSLERHKLRKKRNRQYWFAYTIGLGGFGLWLTILLVFVAPLPEEKATLFNVGMILLSIMTPAMIGLWLGMQAGWNDRKLRDERNRLLRDQNRFHVQLFWEAIKAKDFDTAIDYYNEDGFIWGSTWRALCNGILIGSERDEKWVEKRNERMYDYINDPEL